MQLQGCTSTLQAQPESCTPIERRFTQRFARRSRNLAASENDSFSEVESGVISENTVHAGSQPPGTTSENTERSEPGDRRRGAQPALLSAELAEFLISYAAALAEVPLADDTRRTYLSRVRMYLAWLDGVLADPAIRRRFKGDPLTNPRVRDWAVRDYRLYLLRDATPKRSVRYSSNALAALDDFHVRLGLGKADIGRDDLPKTTPKALDDNAQIRWLRAIEAWPHARDRLLASLPFYAGLRIGDAVALDVPDIRMSARKGHLVVYGKAARSARSPSTPSSASRSSTGCTSGPRGRTPKSNPHCSCPATAAA